MGRLIRILILAAGFLSALTPAIGYDPGVCLNEDEAELLELINLFRADRGHPPVPWSKSLTAVAQWHVWDLATNRPDSGICDYRSWSDASSSTPVFWTPVCLYPGSSDFSGMWNKPSEITGGIYWKIGFEITVIGSVSPAVALSMWMGSAPHADFLLNEGIWSAYGPWPAMGVGRRGDYTVAWFGELADPQGSPSRCADVLLIDGFESNDTIEWSVTEPRCPCWTLRELAETEDVSGTIFCEAGYNDADWTNADYWLYHFNGDGPLTQVLAADAYEPNGGYNACAFWDYLEDEMREVSRGFNNFRPIELQICREQLIETGRKIGAPCVWP